MLDIPTQYCESLIGYFLSQPLNVISNVAFLITAFIAYRYLRNRDIKKLYVLTILLGVVGLSSVLWHMTNSHVGDILDTYSIVLFASVAAILLLTKITKSKITTIISFVILLYLAFISERFTLWNGSFPYVVLLIGFLIAGRIYIKRFPTAKAVFIYAFLTFLIAIVLRSLDILICPFVSSGTHFLWHILVALFGYQIILMLAHSDSHTSIAHS